MKYFLNVLDLERNGEPEESDKYVAFYDSQCIRFSQTGSYYKIFDQLNMVKYFGTQLISFTRWIHTFIDNFARFCQTQMKNTFTFKTMGKLLEKVDPKLLEVSKKSLRHMLEEKGFSGKILELATVTTLTTYGQSIDIDSFAGLCCLAGIGDKLWSIKNGNKSVPMKLLEKSAAKVLLNSRVRAIGKSKDKPSVKSRVIYQTDNQELVEETFDYVIVALPLQSESISSSNSEIDFTSNSGSEMQVTFVYLIYGIVKLFPHLPADKKIELHSVDPDIPYRSINLILPVDYDEVTDSVLFRQAGPKLYRIDAGRVLDQTILSKIFEAGYLIVKEKTWLAYSTFSSKKESESKENVILDEPERERVYYPNRMEWIFSGMEFSCVSAKNVALLVFNKERGIR